MVFSSVEVFVVVVGSFRRKTEFVYRQCRRVSNDECPGAPRKTASARALPAYAAPMAEPQNPAPASTAASVGDASYVTAMSHFYRGELGRAMVWRQRLDATTTWAITTTSTIFTVAFSFREVPHLIFFFNLAVVTVMLWIEARRYRFYDAYRARVRMLEAHFLVPVVAQGIDLKQGNWRTVMCEDLLLPAFKISMLEAVGRRVKRNYGFLYAIMLAAWMTKIFLHTAEPIRSAGDLYRSLAVGNFPSWLVAAVIAVTFVVTTGMLIFATRRTTGEFREFTPNRAQWRL
jgi:uncharacterized membrane protein